MKRSDGDPRRISPSFPPPQGKHPKTTRRDAERELPAAKSDSAIKRSPPAIAERATSSRYGIEDMAYGPSIQQRGYPYAALTTIAAAAAASHAASGGFSSPEEVASRNMHQDRAFEQRLYEAEAQLAAIASHPSLLAGSSQYHPLLGYSPQMSSFDRLAAASSLGGYQNPSRVMTLMPPLTFMEQQELLRHRRFTEQLLASQLTAGAPSSSREASLHSQFQHASGLTGLSGSEPSTASQLGQSLPSLTSLSPSVRAQLLAWNQLHSPRSSGPASAASSLSNGTGAPSQLHSMLAGGVQQHRPHPQFPPVLNVRDRSLSSSSDRGSIIGVASMLGRSSDRASTSWHLAQVQPTASADSHRELDSLPIARIYTPNVADVNTPLIERLPMPVSGMRHIRIPNFLERIIVPLATDEDQNWLSEMLCFVRSDILEVFRATEDDIRVRNSSKGIRLGQVGLRCRFCAHLPKECRAGRSASFPSSLDRIYQSLTMMLRDHFAKCTGMPRAIQDKYIRLKCKTTQGATDSKLFWVNSAESIGLMNSEGGGIWIREDDDAPSDETSEDDEHREEAKSDDEVDSSPGEVVVGAARSTQCRPSNVSRDESVSTSSSLASNAPSPSATAGKRNRSDEEQEEVAFAAAAASSEPASTTGAKRLKETQLCLPSDMCEEVSPFLFTVMSHVCLVHLEDEERVGSRKSLEVGLPGLACRHCHKSGRKGLCRVFPARRRNLQPKILDLCDHLIKCNLIPPETQQEIQNLKDMQCPDPKPTREERIFYSNLWGRMEHDVDASASSS